MGTGPGCNRAWVRQGLGLWVQGLGETGPGTMGTGPGCNRAWVRQGLGLWVQGLGETGPG